ncbi:hypothetical protein SIAM614_02071 [Stappia aggregata IAM 12614]|uniref:Uncharacterized protein n=1 Tax=Roseibium aggregatum (strain ATCC 25650 / DSM 13394 / JCM 20685 / NBRC 16684 / NCIMB 2208 / IAM 12614 / B1) TaxID=384765 RepID=A0P1K6_ROSAI|nr:hypothetical protein SIAM614_02071 [Stappia aggregata IAM 12614] [Roseibium aggregatum IAM 12614]
MLAQLFPRCFLCPGFLPVFLLLTGCFKPRGTVFCKTMLTGAALSCNFFSDTKKNNNKAVLSEGVSKRRFDTDAFQAHPSDVGCANWRKHRNA